MTPPTRAARPGQIAAAARDSLRRLLRGSWEFSIRVYNKAGQDDIFFLAGGIAFNVLVAFVPFLLLLVAIFGFVLQALVDDPQQAAVEYVLSILPASRGIVTLTRNLTEDIVTNRTSAGIFGLLLFIFFSTRLIGSLRSVLRDIFDLRDARGIIGGKIFDVKMVVVAGVLFVINTGITIFLEAIQTYGVQWTGLRPTAPVQALYAQLVAFGFIFLMFLLIYRYLPARRIPWRVALVAASFTGIVWELLKGSFAWYVANIANYQTTYGNLATIVVLVFWIYYSSVVFILGGEVAQVYELNRIRRRQRELLE